MKTLSLWQPWASVIFEKDDEGIAVKPDETRGWRTNIRGRIAIHAAKHVDKSLISVYEPVLRSLRLGGRFFPLGCVLGTVELVHCLPVKQVVQLRKEHQLFWGDYREFGDDGKARFAFVLRDPIKLEKPVPWTGRQGFFEVPDEVFDEILKLPKTSSTSNATDQGSLDLGFTENQ